MGIKVANVKFFNFTTGIFHLKIKLCYVAKSYPNLGIISWHLIKSKKYSESFGIVKMLFALKIKLSVIKYIILIKKNNLINTYKTDVQAV